MDEGEGFGQVDMIIMMPDKIRGRPGNNNKGTRNE